MKKDEFQDSAASMTGKKETSGKGTAGTCITFAAPRGPLGPRPPAPKPPFGMPNMPMAVKIKPVPAVSLTVVSEKTEEV